MAEKTTGQWVGAIVGAVIGFFVGDYSGQAAMAGAALGGAVGGVIDPPKGPHLIGPRLSDLATQTSTYGAPIPRVYGTVALFGNVFWVENNRLKEVEKTEGGGKGGGGPTTTTFAYYATLAVGLCRGPIYGVRRIWAGSKLIYDAGSNDLQTIIASNRAAEGFTIYTGSETQMPDARMQSTLGVANTPAYRGLAYIVFKDFALADYGNTLLGCPFKVEVFSSGSATGLTLVDTVSIPSNGGDAAVVVASGMDSEAEHIFAFADPYFSGYPETATIEGYSAGFLSSFTAKTYTAAYGSYGRILKNTSPYFKGIVTENEFYYLINGLAYYTKTWAFLGNEIWMEDDLSIYDVVTNAADSQNHYLVRVQHAGNVLSAYLKPYDASFVFNLFVLNDFIYVIEEGTTWVFNLEDLSFVESRVNTFTGMDTNWCTSIGDDGRVYVGRESSLSGIGRLNPQMTDFDDYYDTGYYGSAVAKRDGVLYSASYEGGEMVMRAWRLSGANDATVQLATIISEECQLSGLLDASDIDVSDIDQQVRGFRISNIAAIRSSFDALQAAWPFDAIQDGYKIKFVARGNASVATIDISELGAVKAGDKPAIRITHAREMDTQLPRRIGLTYLDVAREYDVGEQGAERLNTDAINVRQVELAIVLNDTEAARIAETLLYLNWLERSDISFTLPPIYGHLQPSDVITVNGDDAVYELRITGVEYKADGLIDCAAKFNAAAVYTSTAIGEAGQSGGPGLTLKGASLAVLLDIPYLMTGMDTPGFPVAMAGYLPSWAGGVLVRSDDDGQTWTAVQGFTTPGAVIGRSVQALGVGRTDIKDEANVLQVSMIYGTLESVSEAQLFNGANHFAIGDAGRWEIVGAQSCVENSDGSWSLSSLLRGRFGTEWAISTHASGDYVVLLDAARLNFISTTLSAVGVERLYRAVSGGKSIDSASDITFTYNGENLECLSPIDINGSRHPTTGDWTLIWTRRSRTLVEPFSGFAMPLGEVAEAYEIEIDATNTGDPLYSSVSLLCHMDDAAFTDQKGNVVTASGNAQISTAQSKFGGVSLLLDGNGDYLSVPYDTRFAFGTGDLCVEAQVMPIALPASGTSMAVVARYGASRSWMLFLFNNGGVQEVRAFMSGNGANDAASAIAVAQVAISTSAFTHLALIRIDGVLYVSVGGTLTAAAVSANFTPFDNSLPITIGARGDATSYFNGYIDEVRITKGNGRYASNFIPPAVAFSNSASGSSGIRVLASTSQSVGYPYADQYQDFGGPAPTISGRVYQKSANLGRGRPLNFSITR